MLPGIAVQISRERFMENSRFSFCSRTGKTILRGSSCDQGTLELRHGIFQSSLSAPLVVLCLGHKICCTNWSLILLLLLIFPPFCLIQVFALQICGFHSFSVALTHLYLLLEPKVCLKSCFIKYQL